MQDFRNLEVWSLAHRLTLDLYAATRGFPADERFGLTSQLRRAAVSIESIIAEGCGRGTDADFARFVQQAMGSASEVECQLLIAKDLGYLQSDSQQSMQATVQRIKRMLAALLKKLRTKS